MKKTVLASAVLLAMAGAASATPDFGTITIDGKTADSSALATETNGIVKMGVSGFLCLGRLFQGQPNEAALCI